MKIIPIFLLGWIFTHEVEVKNIEIKHVKKFQIETVIGKDVDLPRVKNWNEDDFIVIEFSSDVDLLKFSQETGTYISFRPYSCNKPKSIGRLALPGVYSGEKLITDPSLDSGITLQRQADNLFKYNLVLFMVWDKDWELSNVDKESSGQKYYLKHDLRKKPEDICFSIEGWSKFIQRFKTREIRITKSDIKKAIE